MSMVGEFRVGFVPSGQPVTAEMVPVACLDGCQCKAHRTTNVCSCRPEYVCPHHLLMEHLGVVYTGRFE